MEKLSSGNFIRTHFGQFTGSSLCKTACSLHMFGGLQSGQGHAPHQTPLVKPELKGGTVFSGRPKKPECDKNTTFNI